MKQLSFENLLVAPIAIDATSPNPGGPTIIWSSVTSGLLAWTGTKWGSVIYDTEFKSLEDLNSFGFVVRDPATGLFVTRQLIGGSNQLSIDYGTGAQSPTISLTNTGVTPGIYTKVEVDLKGRITSAGLLTSADIPTDLINLYRENYDGTSPYPTASGQNAVALGQSSQATATNSIAIGEHSVARYKNALNRASGRFQMSGDCQTGHYILRAVTTNNFSRQLYLDGPSGTTKLVLLDDTTWTFTAKIVAHRTDGYGGHAGFTISGVIFREAGASTTSFQGTPFIEIIGRSNIGWSINTIANTIDGTLDFIVQGESSKTIRWAASIETIEVTN